MTKAQIVLCASVGFLAGVGIGSVYALPLAWAWAVLAVGVIGTVLLWRLVGVTLLAWACCCLIGAAVGCIRIGTVIAQESDLSVFVGTKQEFEGMVVADPDVRQNNQMLTVRPDGFSEQVLVTTNLAATFFYGDRVWVRGSVAVPEPFNGFDYPGFLARAHIFTVMKYPKIIVLAHGTGQWYMRLPLQIKRWVVRTVRARVAGSSGDLLLGILIGEKRGLPKDALQDFIATGTSHILAVSGFNVSVFIVWLSGLALWIGRKKQLVVSALCIILFAGISGMSAAVLRASLMGLLLLLSTGTGRVYMARNALLLAAAVMVLQNPRILYWDIGFQLSAVATLGIILGMSALERSGVSEWRYAWVARTAGVTLSALVVTTPISLWHFGVLSLVALPVNILVVPFVEAIMAIGLLVLLPGVGIGFGYVDAWLLDGMQRVIYWFARLPAASIPLPLSGSVAWWSLCAVVIVLFLAAEGKREWVRFFVRYMAKFPEV